MAGFLAVTMYNLLMDEKISRIKQWLGTGSINVFGRPFAGKDTQGKRLAEMFGGAFISSGDILRHSQDHQEIQRIMADGGIIPSELFVEVMIPYLKSDRFAGTPLILSEVGRKPGEERAIIDTAEQTGHPIKAVILLDMPEGVVWQRFEASRIDQDRGQRADDNRDVLQTRLDAYRQNVPVVIETYRQMGILFEVDGTLSRDEVTGLILGGLAKKASIQTALKQAPLRVSTL